MAEIASGQYRFAIRDSRGLDRDYSEQMFYDILNNDATPRIAFNGDGTDLDQRMSWYNNVLNMGIISGPANELLVLQLLDATARTFATATCTVRFNTTSTYRGSDGKVARRPNPLLLKDRITKTTSGTRQDPNGVNDNPVTVANQWSDVIAFKPLSNETWFMKSYQKFTSDGV